MEHDQSRWKACMSCFCLGIAVRLSVCYMRLSRTPWTTWSWRTTWGFRIQTTLAVISNFNLWCNRNISLIRQPWIVPHLFLSKQHLFLGLVITRHAASILGNLLYRVNTTMRVWKLMHLKICQQSKSARLLAIQSRIETYVISFFCCWHGAAQSRIGT